MIENRSVFVYIYIEGGSFFWLTVLIDVYGSSDNRVEREQRC